MRNDQLKESELANSSVLPRLGLVPPDPHSSVLPADGSLCGGKIGKVTSVNDLTLGDNDLGSNVGIGLNLTCDTEFEKTVGALKMTDLSKPGETLKPGAFQCVQVTGARNDKPNTTLDEIEGAKCNKIVTSEFDHNSSRESDKSCDLFICDHVEIDTQKSKTSDNANDQISAITLTSDCDKTVTHRNNPPSDTLSNTGTSNGAITGHSSVSSKIEISSKKTCDTLKSHETSCSSRSAKDPNFLAEFYANSRLHYISTWGAECRQYVNKLQSEGTGAFPGREKLKIFVEEKRLLDEVESDNFEPGAGSLKSPRTIMHIDMDCFFVSVGLRKRPELKGRFACDLRQITEVLYQSLKFFITCIYWNFIFIVMYET
jgi:hypothetical protein